MERNHKKERSVPMKKEVDTPMFFYYFLLMLIFAAIFFWMSVDIS